MERMPLIRSDWNVSSRILSRRGGEYMDNCYRLLDLTVYWRQDGLRTRRPAGRNRPKARTRCVPMDVPLPSGRA